MKRHHNKKRRTKPKRSNVRKDIWDDVDWDKNEISVFNQTNPTKIRMASELQYLVRKIKKVFPIFFKKWEVHCIDFESGTVSVMGDNKKYTMYIEDVDLAYWDIRNKLFKKKYRYRYI